jgi:hypothetical protein
MNKLKQKEETPEQRSGPGDYYELICRYDTWYISPETAAHIGRQLDRRWRPRWIKFVDLKGSRAWVRSGSVESINESTERQRTADRDFQYLRRKEERTDRRWDDDEN